MRRLAQALRDGAVSWSQTVVDFPVGHYRFTYRSGEKGFDRGALGTVVFADIERVA